MKKAEGVGAAEGTERSWGGYFWKFSGAGDAAGVCVMEVV